MLIEITSKDNSKVKYAARLKISSNRKKSHQFLAEGIKSLELALKSNLVTDIFTTKKLLNIPSSVNQYIVNEQILDKIAFSVNPEGIVFICNEIEQKLNKNAKKILYLDHINDPGNMGTMIRTALAFNYDMICISSDSVSIYNEKVVASTKGAMFLIPIVEDVKLSDLKENHTVIVSTLSEDSVFLEEVKKPDSFVLVVGNEAHGVSSESLALSDIKVKIRIENIDSLNVSVAAGILMNSLH